MDIRQNFILVESGTPENSSRSWVNLQYIIKIDAETAEVTAHDGSGNNGPIGFAVEHLPNAMSIKAEDNDIDGFPGPEFAPPSPEQGPIT